VGDRRSASGCAGEVRQVGQAHGAVPSVGRYAIAHNVVAAFDSSAPVGQRMLQSTFVPFFPACTRTCTYRSARRIWIRCLCHRRNLSANCDLKPPVPVAVIQSYWKDTPCINLVIWRGTKSELMVVHELTAALFQAHCSIPHASIPDCFLCPHRKRD